MPLTAPNFLPPSGPFAPGFLVRTEGNRTTYATDQAYLEAVIGAAITAGETLTSTWGAAIDALTDQEKQRYGIDFTADDGVDAHVRRTLYEARAVQSAESVGTIEAYDGAVQVQTPSAQLAYFEAEARRYAALFATQKERIAAATAITTDDVEVVWYA